MKAKAKSKAKAKAKSKAKSIRKAKSTLRAKAVLDLIIGYEQQGDWTVKGNDWIIKGNECITPDGITHEGRDKIEAMEKAISYWVKWYIKN